MPQLTLPFGVPILNGKKTERLTMTCSSEFRGLLEMVSRMAGETISEIMFRYILEGVKGDIGTMFMAEPHLEKKLGQLLPKKF